MVPNDQRCLYYYWECPHWKTSLYAVNSSSVCGSVSKRTASSIFSTLILNISWSFVYGKRVSKPNETFFSLPWRNSPQGARAFNRGSTITIRHTTLGRTPLDEWSARKQRHLNAQHTIHTTKKYPCSWRDFFFSNPQSRQASGRRPMP